MSVFVKIDNQSVNVVVRVSTSPSTCMPPVTLRAVYNVLDLIRHAVSFISQACLIRSAVLFQYT